MRDDAPEVGRLATVTIAFYACSMKKPTIVQRLRESPSGLFVPVEFRRPFRLWMTGSLAVVMAAIIPMREL